MHRLLQRGFPLALLATAALVAGTLPANAYHLPSGHCTAVDSESNPCTYLVSQSNVVPEYDQGNGGLVDSFRILCESYGLTDPWNFFVTPHGSTDGSCAMSSNPTNARGCPPPTPWDPITDPSGFLPVDRCGLSVRAAGTFTNFQMVTTCSPATSLLTVEQDCARGPTLGPRSFAAAIAPTSTALFKAQADKRGVCVSDNYVDVATLGHVEAFLPHLLLVSATPLPSVPGEVVVNTLPGDMGHWMATPNGCSPMPAGFVDQSGGLGLFYADGATNTDDLFLY